MEKKISKVKKYRQVEDGTKDVVKFVAIDGKEFYGNNAEKECLEWEKTLDRNKKWESIKKNKYDTVDLEYIKIPDCWYFSKNEDELETIKHFIGYYDTYNIVSVNDVHKNKSEDLTVGKWVSGRTVDGGDYRGEVIIYTKDFIEKKLKAFMDSFE